MINILNTLRSTPNKTLYHYTSLDALLNILNNKYLYATEMKYLNDSSEIVYSKDLINHAICKKLATINDNTKKYETLYKQFNEWCANRLVYGDMLFSCSFTECGNLLSQWRGYADNCRGISIGFDPIDILNQANIQSMSIYKCIYDKSTQNTIINSILQILEHAYDKGGEITDPKKRHPNNSCYQIFETYESTILQIASIIKNPHFSEENEWRVVSNSITSYVKEPIEYRIGKSMLIPYIRFMLPINSNNGIKLYEIITGPTPNHNIAFSALAKCVSKKYSSPTNGIIASGIPYRTW